MLNAELAFRTADIALDVRSFSIEEGLSQPFEALITARSQSADLDLDAIVGYGAAFRLAVVASLTADKSRYRVWSGVCSHAEQVRVEPDGVSTYCIRIMPMFWRTTQRRNHRIFQHSTVPQIVSGLLGEYGIEPELRLDPSAYARHEYRVQYGETDFAFISRLLEEAGVSYLFEQVDPTGEGELETMKVVLADRPGESKARRGGPIHYIGDTEQWPDGPFISNARFIRQLRPGRFTIRDYDFQSSPDLRLMASVRARVKAEERYELYHYVPGAFLAESGGDRGRSAGTSRVDEQVGQARADVGLDSVRTGRRNLNFRSNVADLHPGTVFRMTEYPRREVDDETGLLLVRRTIEGDVEELTDMHAEATLADEPYRPARQTPKPRMSGIQSAIVVGPRGEEIYTDEYGRVRVQFHWDREGKRDENSSCWIRVTQAWAGNGWGITSVPRVGTEVMVDFFEGDPDKPVIVGCVHNSAAQTPYPLPEHKTKTVWKSSSSPGGGGSNEISFEDARGEEKIFVHAQKELEQKVEANETRTTGADLSAIVVKNEQREVQGDQKIVVKGDRSVENAGQASQNAQRGLAMGSGASTGMACTAGAVTLTNGQTSLMLDGPNVYIDCGANLQLSAGRMLTLSGKQVRIIGDPEVFINCHDAVRPTVRKMPAFWLGGEASAARERERTRAGRPGRDRGRPQDPGAVEDAEFDQMRGRRREDMPERVRAPRAVNEQLRDQARNTRRRGSSSGRLLDALTYDSMKKNVDRRLKFEQRRLEKLDRDANSLFERHKDHVQGLPEELGERLKEEKSNLGEFFDEVGAVFKGDRGNFKDSCGALYEAFKEQVNNINTLRKDIVAMIEVEKAFFQEWKDLGETAAGIFDDFKEIVENPGDAVLDMLFGDQADEVGGLIDGARGGRDAADAAGGVADAAGGAPRTPGGLGETGSAPDRPGRGSRFDRGISQRQPTTGAQSASDKLTSGRGSLQQRQAGSPNLRNAAEGQGNLSRGQSGGSNIQDAAGGKSQLSRGQAGNQNLKDAASGRGGMSRAQSSGMGSRDALAQRGAGAQQMSGGNPLADGPGSELTSGPSANANIGEAAQGRGLASRAGSGLPAGAEGSGGLQKAAGNVGGAAGQGAAQPLGTAGNSFARTGGLAASDVSSNVSPGDVSFLQTPSDGQLMVVPSDGAASVNQAAVSSSMVQAQMSGQPVQSAVSESLSNSGYVVYERGHGDWFGEFVKAGASQAG